MTVAQVVAIAVFVGVMALIVTEKVHRALAALLGALVVMIAGVVPFERTFDYLDLNTLGVLIGMMLFVGATKRSGLFEYLAIKSAKLAKGDPWRIMVVLVLITALLSAFIDNVTTVLLIGPMTFMICRELRLAPVPFFITQIIASNIGGTATLVGDPPNIMIGSQTGLSFLDFVTVNGPILLVVLFATLVGFRFIYGRKLAVAGELRENLMRLDEKQAILSRSLFVKSIVMIALLVVAFMLHGVLQLPSSIIALSGAAIMMLIGRQDVGELIIDVEWTTIGFFCGLFIVVGGLVETGLIDLLAQYLIGLTNGQTIAAILVILVASAIISAIIDNIPFVATMIPVILAMEATGIDVMPLWWALSLGACLGGNGTLVGASANMVLSGISNRAGHPLTFINYLKVGAPMMALSIIISAIYLVLRFGL